MVVLSDARIAAMPRSKKPAIGRAGSVGTWGQVCGRGAGALVRPLSGSDTGLAEAQSLTSMSTPLGRSSFISASIVLAEGL